MALQQALDREAAKTRPPTSTPDPSSRPRYRTSMFKRLIDVSSVIHESYIPTVKSDELLRTKVLRRPGDRPFVLIESTVQRDPNTGEEFISSESAKVANQVIVRKKTSASFDAFKNHVETQGGVIVKQVSRRLGSYLVSIEYAGPDTVSNAQDKMLSNTKVVAHVQPNFVSTFQNAPNDPLYYWQWGMDQSPVSDTDIDAPKAWDIVTDAISRSNQEDIIVAVTDTGILQTHPDLVQNLWVNPGEGSIMNGVDNDGNGYVDDIHGWDFVYNDNNPEDDYGHGTHVAGIVGAHGNNAKGVTGTAWKVKIMNLRLGDEIGFTDTTYQVPAIEYALSKGAHIVNMSWGGDNDLELFAAIAAGRSGLGTVFVAASGNFDRSNDGFLPVYPASFPTLDNIIAVTSVDPGGGRAYRANWGLTSVDIAAPGREILSTWNYLEAVPKI